MCKRQLQQTIRNEEGIILSTDTLNVQHLLPAVYDMIVGYNLRTNIKKQIQEVFEGDEPTFSNQFYGKATIPESKHDEARQLFDEDVWDYMNDCAPAGYYFGCMDGDGACIGFFQCEEEKCA